MSFKRRKVLYRAPVRPIDKNLVTVNKTAVSGTQETTTLATFTSPCTVVGLRWDMTVLHDAGTGQASYAWAVVILADGNIVSTLDTSNGSQFYQPEQAVMAFGAGRMAGGLDREHYVGSTKTGRKVRNGDSIRFICRGAATDTSAFLGVFQFFCRS